MPMPVRSTSAGSTPTHCPQDPLSGVGGDMQEAFAQGTRRNLRNDLLVAADSITNTMSSLVKELHSAEEGAEEEEEKIQNGKDRGVVPNGKSFQSQGERWTQALEVQAVQAGSVRDAKVSRGARTERRCSPVSIPPWPGVWALTYLALHWAWASGMPQCPKSGCRRQMLLAGKALEAGTGDVRQAGIDTRKARSSPRGTFLSIFLLHTWTRPAGCQMSPPARERGDASPRRVGSGRDRPVLLLVGLPLAQSCMNWHPPHSPLGMVSSLQQEFTWRLKRENTNILCV
ncbi:hypothetical protein MC885_008470 [Smutsia gigantea]|nr:hypothetical protein MC885_008470 [Smutsia gigantea]